MRKPRQIETQNCGPERAAVHRMDAEQDNFRGELDFKMLRVVRC